jgi:glycosyltransferase involved in cell wall biosynthesis
VPGLLLPAENSTALAGAIGSWLADPALRDGLRQSARDRRTTLLGWSSTAAAVDRVIRALETG